jgi:threonine/homoserine/homoserine lactone efflux protein
MSLLPFIAVAAVVIAAPGPDMALVGRNALVGGRRIAFCTSLGVALGLTVWSLAASVGVAALLQRSEPAFTAVRICGAAYLVWLGVQALRAAWTGHSAGPAATGGVRRGDSRQALRQGLLSNLSNPKIAVFFTSFLPQFATGGASFAALLGLGLVFCAMTLLWLGLYGTLVARAGDMLRRPRVRRALEAVTGMFLVAFGVRVATER